MTIKRSPLPLGHRRIASIAPVFHEGNGKYPVSVVGVHYSHHHGLKELDPGSAGSGSSGMERRHYGMGNYGKQGGMKRMTHFYVRTSKSLPEKEHAVSGHHAYEAILNNLYDVKADPEGIIERAEKKGKGSDFDHIIHQIHRAGYDGYVSAHKIPGIPSLTASVSGVKKKIPVMQIK